MTKYRIGDVVHITESSGDSTAGRTGTIVSKGHSDSYWDWMISFDDHTANWGYFESEIELVPVSVSVPLEDIQVGDKVRWTIGDDQDRTISEFVVTVMNQYGVYGRDSIAYAGRPWAEEGQGVLELIERKEDSTGEKST